MTTTTSRRLIAPLALALCGLVTACGSGPDAGTRAGDALQAQPAAQGSAAPPLRESPPSRRLPATSPVRGDVSAEQSNREGDYLPADVCMDPAYTTASAAVLGAQPESSSGGFLTDVAGETTWALDYAGAVTSKDPAESTDGEGYPKESRLLCWYTGPISISEEDALQGADAGAQYRVAIVSIAVGPDGAPLPATPMAIFRSPRQLPIVAAPVAHARTAFHGKSRRASAREAK